MAEARYPGAGPVALRCPHCGHFLGRAPRVVRLLACVRYVPGLRLPVVSVDQVRRRCHACSWLSLFVPLRLRRSKPPA